MDIQALLRKAGEILQQEDPSQFGATRDDVASAVKRAAIHCGYSTQEEALPNIAAMLYMQLKSSGLAR